MTAGMGHQIDGFMVAAMSWMAMAPADVCNVMDFWIRQTWPLTRDEVHQLAVRHLGWTTEIEDGKEYLLDASSGLSNSHVSTITGGHDNLSYLQFRVTDVIGDRSADSTALVSDAFTLIVREGTSRWGKPKLKRTDRGQLAGWDVEGGARVEFKQGPMAARAQFITPQTVDRDKILERS